MEGDPVTTEPTVLQMEVDVKALLEKKGLLDFFRKFSGFSESISLQVADYWEEGRVKVNGLEFTISEGLISEVSGLPLEGEVVCREKTNQVEQLSKFIRDNETFCWLQSGIARESLPKPWDRVAIQIMKYLTLEGKYRKLFGYHLAILNSIRNNETINVPLFLFKSMEKSVKTIKLGKGKLPLHQGLLNLLFQFEKAKSSSAVISAKGNLHKVSGTPVSKAQLLLGPTSSSQKPNAISSDSEEEEDSHSEDVVRTGGKRDESRKRKHPPQVLATNHAKCIRRSSRLQKKSVEKAKITDYVETTDEEKEEKEDGNPSDLRKSGRDLDPAEVTKGSAKYSYDSQKVIEELKSHLKILNGLGGPLTSTCACINLLALEITNYLKEVVNRLKELNSESP